MLDKYIFILLYLCDWAGINIDVELSKKSIYDDIASRYCSPETTSNDIIAGNGTHLKQKNVPTSLLLQSLTPPPTTDHSNFDPLPNKYIFTLGTLTL